MLWLWKPNISTTFFCYVRHVLLLNGLPTGTRTSLTNRLVVFVCFPNHFSLPLFNNCQVHSSVTECHPYRHSLSFRCVLTLYRIATTTSISFSGVFDVLPNLFVCFTVCHHCRHSIFRCVRRYRICSYARIATTTSISFSGVFVRELPSLPVQQSFLLCSYVSRIIISSYGPIDRCTRPYRMSPPVHSLFEASVHLNPLFLFIRGFKFSLLCLQASVNRLCL